MDKKNVMLTNYSINDVIISNKLAVQLPETCWALLVQ
jgi:hypothetical protein